MRAIPHAWHFAVLILSVASLLLAGFLSWGNLSEAPRRVIQIADYAICAVFLIDFLWTLKRAPSKTEYLRWGWLDLLSCIPAAPLLRFGRIGRVVRIVRVLRILQGARGIREALDRSRATSALLLVLTCSFLAVVVGAILVLEWEKGSEGSIQTGEDAIWWAIVTMTTVGYGDHFPVTTGGRAVAVVLMGLGIGLFGTFTGFVATWFEAPEEEEEIERDERLLSEMKELRREVAELKKSLDRQDR